MNIFATGLIIIAACVSMAHARPSDLKQMQAASGNQLVNGKRNIVLALVIRTRCYKLDDTIHMKALLTNKGTHAIGIFAPLYVGQSAGFSTWVESERTGKPVSEGSFIPDALPPPPDDAEDFVRITPNHIYGVLWEVPLSELGIVSTGDYLIEVEYHSPIPSSMHFGFPILTSKMPAIHSNDVLIQVRGKRCK